MVVDHRALIRQDPVLNQTAYNYCRLTGMDPERAKLERRLFDDEAEELEAQFLRFYPHFVTSEGAH